MTFKARKTKITHMHLSRRNLLKGLALGSGSMLLPTMAQRILANGEGKTSAPRFVFVIQSNGFDAVQACPDSIPFQKYDDRDKFENIDLKKIADFSLKKIFL